MTHRAIDPNQERTIQAAFDGHVPAVELARLREFFNEAVSTLERRNAEIERLRVALDMVCDEIEGTEEHGGGAFDEGCSVCRAIIEARKLTSSHSHEQLPAK